VKLAIRQGGYKENYRKRTLEQALKVNDRLVEDERKGRGQYIDLRIGVPTRDGNRNSARSMDGALRVVALPPSSSLRLQIVSYSK
jgi:hypothetical protein